MLIPAQGIPWRLRQRLASLHRLAGFQAIITGRFWAIPEEISADTVRSFVLKRQQDGASNAEINRELAALKRAFTLGVQSAKLLYKPHIAMLNENNVRKRPPIYTLS